MTNKEKYKRTFDVLAASATLDFEVDIQKNSRKKRNLKNIAAVVAICIVLGGVGKVGYAAAKHYGILDFSYMQTAIPDESRKKIQKDVSVKQQENQTIFNADVREVLYDAQRITLVYEVAAQDKKKYLFIPEYAMPEDKMSEWGYDNDKTVEEYAKEKKLIIVNIGGGIVEREKLGIVEESLDFHSVEDDIIDILVQCNVTVNMHKEPVSLVATNSKIRALWFCCF